MNLRILLPLSGLLVVMVAVLAFDHRRLRLENDEIRVAAVEPRVGLPVPTFQACCLCMV